jgi:hypothetical protein
MPHVVNLYKTAERLTSRDMKTIQVELLRLLNLSCNSISLLKFVIPCIIFSFSGRLFTQFILQLSEQRLDKLLKYAELLPLVATVFLGNLFSRTPSNKILTTNEDDSLFFMFYS